MKEYRVTARYNGRTVYGRVEGKNKKDAEKELRKLRPEWRLVDLHYLSVKEGYFNPHSRDELLKPDVCTCPIKQR